MLAQAGQPVPDLAQLDDDGVIIFIPVAGNNLASWISRLANLNLPEFHIVDRHAKPEKTSPNQRLIDKINARDRCQAYLTSKEEIENYLHPNAIKAARPEVDISFGDFDDVPDMAAQAIHNRAPDSQGSWDELQDDQKRKKVSKNRRKC